MKDRITLAILLILLWAVLFIFQKYTPVQSSIYIVLGFMGLYAFLIQLAQSHQKRWNKRKFSQADLNYKPFISILIPAHNEEFVIKDTVDNILAVDYKDYELIIIDDRSTDRTPEVLKKISEESNGRIKYIIRDKDAFPGKSAVLNDALPQTQGEVICVFDADARIKPDFFNIVLPYIADEDTGAVQARKVISNSGLNLLTRCQDNEYTLDAHFQKGRDCIRGAVELRGNGQLIKKEALIDVDGWNNFTITDDLDLSTRLHLKNWDVRFCTETEVYEEGVQCFLPLVRQRRRWVEGSIRRYLEYFTEVLFSKDISLRVSLDMLAYLSEFVLPLWLLSEWAIQGVKFIRNGGNVLSAVLIIPILCFFFISGLIYSLKKYKKLTFWQAARQAIETGVYMVGIWTPLVTFIVFKIIFTQKTMDWGKTAHGVPKTQDESVEETV